MQPAFIDVDNPPNTLSNRASQLSDLSDRCSPSNVPFSISLDQDAFSDLPTNPDVPQPNFSDQIAPSDTFFPSTEAPETSSRQLFGDHTRTDEHTSHHRDDLPKIHESPIESQSCEPGTAAASLGLPSCANSVAPLQGRPEQQGTYIRSGITNTVALSETESAVEVSMTSFPNTMVSSPHKALTFKLTTPFRREYAASHHFTRLRTCSYHARWTKRQTRPCISRMSLWIQDSKIQMCASVLETSTRS
jgi:hypothetical protein